jgi:Ca2+-binding RTX toxin-like protein
LSGRTGADVLAGGLGNDTYVIDNLGDSVTELLNEGADKVNSSISYTLGANLENLTLTGAAAINGRGNSLNNLLTGNAANNTLVGYTGNDTLTGNAGADILNGGLGNDILRGGVGDDTYIFNRGDGLDTLSDSDATAGNKDTVQVGVDPLDLIFTRSGAKLTLDFYGSTDALTVQAWYGGSANQTEVIRAANGSTLLNTEVERLIQDMASFSVRTGLTWEQGVQQRPDEVQTIIAGHWQPAAA